MTGDFGESYRSASTAIKFLLDRHLIDSETVAALMCLRAGWEYSSLVKKMFIERASHSDCEKNTELYPPLSAFRGAILFSMEADETNSRGKRRSLT